MLILNGPNLNLLGKRETQVYGSVSFEDYLEEIKKKFPQVKFTYEQSNIEGELINVLHRHGLKDSKEMTNAIIINPGGYSHTSVALADALAAVVIPVIEVHISNIHAREEFRHHTITGARCLGIISGFGLNSYTMAIEYLMNKPK
ncbi:MAG: type II 3-dehydroquinate dehydratase [Flavobacteriales bacterium]